MDSSSDQNLIYLAKTERDALQREVKKELKELCTSKYGAAGDEAARLRCAVEDDDLDEAVQQEAARQLKTLEMLLFNLTKQAGDAKTTGEVHTRACGVIVM